jgi:hypothetical protein
MLLNWTDRTDWTRTDTLPRPPREKPRAVCFANSANTGSPTEFLYRNFLKHYLSSPICPICPDRKKERK